MIHHLLPLKLKHIAQIIFYILSKDICGDDIRKGDIGYCKETQIYYKVLAVEEHRILISWEFHGIEDNEWISREDYQKLEKIKRENENEKDS